MWVFPQQLRLVLVVFKMELGGWIRMAACIEPGLRGFCRSTMSELWYDLRRALDVHDASLFHKTLFPIIAF